MKKSHLTRREFALQLSAVPLVRASARGQTGAVRTTGKPAILGGTPVRTRPYPEWPMLETLDETRFLASLREKKWCRLGAEITSDFEAKWAKALGAKHAIGVVNGTNALYAALYALDVGPGDEVIVPPYTFVATVNAVLQQFALPVFVDTDARTQLIDASKIEAAVTPETRCILPVHLGGNVADMDAIGQLAARRGLSVVEDACQGHFSEWKGKRVGSLGDVGCFSFQASKILPCGEGGAVVTNRPELYDRLHAFQNNGRDRVTGTQHGYLHQGTNLRMTEFQSALLLAQMTRLEEQCRIRDENGDRLSRMLKEIGGVEPAGLYPGCTRNTHYVYLASYDSSRFKGLSRNAFARALQREGIPCGQGYVPLNKEPFLKKLLDSRSFRRIYSEQRLRRYWEMNECPANDRVCQTGLFFSQTCLLGNRADTEQIGEAVARIQRHAEEIAKTGATDD